MLHSSSSSNRLTGDNSTSDIDHPYDSDIVDDSEHDRHILAFPELSLHKELTISSPQTKMMFVGDVHGQYHEYMDMLKQYSKDDTTVVLLGDFITRGPHSKKMVDHIIKVKDNIKTRDKLQCIFGNNEMMVLLGWLEHFAPRTHKGLNVGDEFLHWKQYKPSKKHIKLAKKLGFQRLLKLTEICSVRLDIDLALTGEKYIAVHAGILPTDVIKVDNTNNNICWRDIWSTVNMRWVDKKNWNLRDKFEENVKNPIRWYKLWQNDKYDNYTIVYGHDAHHGLVLNDNTVGLDTGCARGAQLTAMEIFFPPELENAEQSEGTERKSQKRMWKYARAIHQVPCNRRS